MMSLSCEADINIYILQNSKMDSQGRISIQEADEEDGESGKSSL